MNWGDNENKAKAGDSAAVHIDMHVYWPVDDWNIANLGDWYEWDTGAPLEEVSTREYQTRIHCERCKVNVRKGDWSMVSWRDNGEAYCNKCAEEVSNED